MKNKYFNICHKLALTTDGTINYRLGAVVVKGGSVISMGRNTRRYSGFADKMAATKGKKAWSLHAEVSALLGLSQDQTKGADLYVTRVLACGNRLTMSKPCESCMAAIYHCKIRRVYYTDYDGNIQEIKVRDYYESK